MVSSLFSSERELLDEAAGVLEERFGSLDWVGPERPFDRTRYYEREMGWPLVRRFMSFETLTPPDRLVEIKLQTNEVEEQFRQGPNRRVNIDPGYIALERLVLATGKNYVHRIYLGRGIYADLTLVYVRGGFRPLPWTYPDYADPDVIGEFNDLRKGYLEQLRRKGLTA